MDNKQRGSQALNELDKSLKSRERKEKARPLGIVIVAAVAIVALVGGIWFLATRNGDDEDITAEEEATETQDPAADAEPLAMQREEQLPETVSCEYNESDGSEGDDVSLPETEDISARGTVTVSLDTNQGAIGMELDREAAPCTVNAIEHLASEGYYDDTTCHRLTTQGIHVLQCGDPTGSGSGGPGFQFDNEYPTDELGDESSSTQVIYPKGSIAMANAGPGTNGSQFFLNYDDSPLTADYTYFGQIDDEGLKVLEGIAEAGVKDGQSPGDGEPAEEVTITKATVSD